MTNEILVIDDNLDIRKLISGILEEKGFGVREAANYDQALDEIKKIKDKYPDFSGVFDWEYINAPPDKNDPSQWSRLIKNC